MSLLYLQRKHFLFRGVHHVQHHVSTEAQNQALALESTFLGPFCIFVGFASNIKLPACYIEDGEGIFGRMESASLPLVVLRCPD